MVSYPSNLHLSTVLVFFTFFSGAFCVVVKYVDVQPNGYLKLDCNFEDGALIPDLLDVRWTLVKNDLKESRSPVKLNDRVDVDYEGNLHFSNIRYTDFQDDDESYQCVFDKGSHLMEGKERYKMRVKSPQKVNVEASYKWTSTYNITVTVGSEVRLKCLFEGNPTPRVFWYKSFHPMPTGHDTSWRNATSPTEKRITTGKTQNELVIRKITHGDEGLYQCQGMNKFNRHEYYNSPIDFEVALVGKPYFDKKRSGVIYDQNEEIISVVCFAAGFPQPKLRFVKDGIIQPSVKAYKMANWNPRSPVRLKAYNESGFGGAKLECLAENEYGKEIYDPLMIGVEPTEVDNSGPRDPTTEGPNDDKHVSSATPTAPGPRVSPWLAFLIVALIVASVVVAGWAFNRWRLIGQGWWRFDADDKEGLC